MTQPERRPQRHQFVGIRTTVRPGELHNYRHVHSRIPDQIAQALCGSGLVSWRIWSDGNLLFHCIETTHGFEDMVRKMAKLGQIDPEWDRLIATMIDDAPGSDRTLDLVWGLNAQGQFTAE